MNSKIPNANNYLNLSDVSEMERMVKSNMLDVARLKTPENEIAKSIAYNEKIEKMLGISNIKAMWESAHLDDVRRMENSLFNSSAMRAMREISELTSFKALNSLSNLPFENLAKNFVFDEKLLTTFDINTLFEADTEIAKELATKTDFNLLSDSTKQKIYRFLENCIICYMINVATGGNPNVVENLSKLFSTHEQVEFIDTPFENNAPDHEFNVEESETLAFSNHSANLVDEWTNENEDEIWT